MKRIISLVLSLLLVSLVISTGMVASASTVQDNYDTLRAFVNSHGTPNATGSMVILGFSEQNGEFEHRYQFRNTSSGIEIVLFILGSASTRAEATTTIILTRSSSDVKISSSLIYYYQNNLRDLMDGRITISRSDLSGSKTYSVTGSGISGIIKQSEFSETFNSTLKLLCATMDVYMYTQLGFGFKGLGFTSYSGLGSAACDPSLSVHSGGTEVRNAVAATCGKDGYTGDTYCKTCGEKIRSGSVISNTGHDYSKEVATEQYLVSKANCTEPAKYYKSCECGAKGTATFVYGEALGHTASAWLSDSDNHWKVCDMDGCGVIIEDTKATHADENNDGKCDACEYNVGITPVDPDPVVPNNPTTGDNGTLWLWIVLMMVSGFCIAVTYGKKKLAK